MPVTDEQDLRKTWQGEDHPTSVRLVNHGPGMFYVSWRRAGVPADGRQPEQDAGVAIRRRFLDENGAEIRDKPFAQDELVVIEWTLQAMRSLDNLAIEDLLPGGLEIENPNLKTSRQLPWTCTKSSLNLRHVDRRDDRLIGFTGAVDEGTHRYYYAVRAVTPGRFALPAISAVCMYDETVFSRHGRSTIQVKGRAGEDAP